MPRRNHSARGSLACLLILALGIIPTHPRTSAAGPDHPIDDALGMVYFSDAVLSGMTDLESIAFQPFLFSPAPGPNQEDPDNAALAAALQAAKEKRNDLDASCSLLVAKYRAAGKDCEADRIQAACNERRQGFDSEIGRLHDLRGDRRRPLTKAWHWFKRQGKSFWHRIGPVGRNFLRQAGPEVLQVVASGGVLNKEILRDIVKQVARNMGRQRIREIVYQGVENLLIGQIEMARAAGVDLCSDEKTATTTQDGEPAADGLTFTLTTDRVDFAWQSLLQPDDKFHVCGGLWPNEDEMIKPLTFPITINYQEQTLSAQVSGSRQIINQAEGNSGPVVTRINQDFTVRLDGPYQVTELVDGVVLILSGTAHLTLTQDGEVECHYWVIPDQGDPVLESYWVSRVQTMEIEKPYEVRIYTPDEDTREITLSTLEPNWEVNSFFVLYTDPTTISIADLILLWPD